MILVKCCHSVKIVHFFSRFSRKTLQNVEIEVLKFRKFIICKQKTQRMTNETFSEYLDKFPIYQYIKVLDLPPLFFAFVGVMGVLILLWFFLVLYGLNNIIYRHLIIESKKSTRRRNASSDRLRGGVAENDNMNDTHDNIYAHLYARRSRRWMEFIA